MLLTATGSVEVGVGKEEVNSMVHFDKDTELSHVGCSFYLSYNLIGTFPFMECS